MDKKISICIAYHNRKDQIDVTLKTIGMSKYKNIEVIIVDDGSNEDQDLDNIIKQYNYQIKLIKITKEEKKHINPCVAYNMAFKEATGEIIIIQNAEVAHIGDVISYTAENLRDKTYFSFPCLSSADWNENVIFSFLLTYVQTLEHVQVGIKINKNIESKYDNKGNYVWYNHPIYRPCYLHFLSAINKKDLDEIGGFDEIYKDGVDYDDNDFIIKLEKADIDLQIPSGSEIPFGVHLYHENVVTVNRDELSRKNEELFKNKWGGDYKTVLKKVINNW